MKDTIFFISIFFSFLFSSPLFPANYYWVGGSGNWSDTGHWATTSGGTTFHAQPPSAGDDVFFDAASFSGPGQTVLFDAADGYCRNMNWTGATGTPVFSGADDRRLHIAGSLTLLPAMEWLLDGSVWFESTTFGTTINAAGHLFRQNVYFDNTGGWTLLDSLPVAGTLFFQRGSLVTNGRRISCEKFITNTTTNRRIDLGNSRIILRSLTGDSTLWHLDSRNLNLSAGRSSLEFLAVGRMQNQGGEEIEYNRVVFSDFGRVDIGEGMQFVADSLWFQRNGIITNDAIVGSIQLTKGYEYRLASNAEFIFSNIASEGGCDGLISLRSTIDDVPAFMRSANDLIGEFLILKDMHNLGLNTFIANNSIDLGNNLNWVVNALEPRTLYWVGGTGDWEDRAHWSRTSGGPGGECIPTPIDDVIFDENSFSGPGQIARGRIYIDHYCKNLIWRNVTGTPQFDVQDLHVFASLTFVEAMQTRIDRLWLRSEEPDQTVATFRQSLSLLTVEGSGSWQLQDDLNARELEMLNGTFQTNDQSMSIEYFSATGPENPKVLVLDNSRVTVRGSGASRPSWYVNQADLMVSAGASVIEFTDPESAMSNQSVEPLDYPNIWFSSTDGASVLSSALPEPHFNLVRFDKDGTVLGAHRMDTLIFSPGKSYQLESGIIQTILEHFQIVGNACLPIRLSSTRAGERSIVFKENGTVQGDHIEMRDQDARGGADFFAGPNSINIGSSNTGWVFEPGSGADPVGFLGEDRVLCENTAITLDANNNSSAETYLWQDGSTASTWVVTGPGTYWVTVQVTDTCAVSDTISIRPPEDLAIDLGADTTLCQGETLHLDATVGAQGVSYRWQDGTPTPGYTVSGPGTYEVLLSLSGCTASASIVVNYIIPVQPGLGPDRTLCDGETLVLDASANGVTYRWQDGSTGPTFAVSGPGLYSVEVLTGRCAARDSISIDYYPPIALNLGNDTTLCDGEPLRLDAFRENGRYTWQDGSMNAQFDVRGGGTFWVSVDVNGCIDTDSITVGFQPSPVFELGPDLELCVGETAVLDGTSPGATFLWNDGTTFPTLTVTTSGSYWLEASLNGCTRKDSVSVTVFPYPVVNLGEDREVCQGTNLVLDAGVDGATYRWQDGRTTKEIAVTQGGTYWVEVAFSRCSTADTVAITLKPAPVFELGPDRLVCEGDQVELSIGVPADEYFWSDGTTEAALTVGRSGLFWAEAVLGDCAARDTVLVEFQLKPLLDLGPDTSVCEERPLLLRAGIPADRFQWQDGSKEATYEVVEPGLYWVEVEDGPCTVRDSILIGGRTCLFFEAFLPNAFSPNGDGANDEFRPLFPPELKISTYQLAVFDRWGNQVFLSTNPDEGWDGTFRSQELPVGVYLFFATLEYIDDEGEGKQTLSGDVMLIR